MSRETSDMTFSSLHSEFVERLRREDVRYVYTYPYKGAYRPLNELKPILTSWEKSSGPLNIYVHVPYCDMKCSFCNLLTTTSHPGNTFANYADAISREARLLSELHDWSHYEVNSLYLGGGTPTLLPAVGLSKVMYSLRNLFRFGHDAELAIESTPDALDISTLRRLRASGFHRISLGIQTFDEAELRAMGRTYASEIGVRMVAAALATGFDNVNVDLLYGLPGQSAQTWMRSLRQAVDLAVPTITVYPLVYRSQTRLGKIHDARPDAFPFGADRYSLYETAVEFLTHNGYRQNTMVAFTKLVDSCRHESNEFRGVPTLGIGAGALSYSPSVHYTSGRYFALETSAQVIDEYLRTIAERELPVRSGIVLDSDESQRRYVILGLLSTGVDLVGYRRQFNASVDSTFFRRDVCIVRGRLP